MRPPASFRCLSRLLSLALLPVLAACGPGGDPGPLQHPLLVQGTAWEGEAPGGAESIDLETFADRLDRGEIHLLLPGARAAELEEIARGEAEAMTSAREVFADDPRMLELLDALSKADGGEAELLPDRSVLFRGIPADPPAGTDERLFVEQGIGPALVDAVAARLRFETAEEQRGIYALMYPALPADYVATEQLPTPSDLENVAYETVRDLNRRVGRDWDLFGDPVPDDAPPGYPASWRDEEGVEWRSDRDTAFDVRPSGIWQDAGFELKWCATRVRDQGRRGTGTAFAVTAAVEARVAAMHSRWLNLSEQMLYNQALLVWDGVSHEWDNNFRTGWYLGQMVARRYGYSFESTWDYNRSLLREVLPLRYIRSCWVDEVPTLYGGEFCSDAAHQSRLYVTRLDSREWYGYEDPAGTIPPDAGVRVEAFREVFGSSASHRGPDGTREDPLLVTKSLLAIKIPVVLMFVIPASFPDGIGRDGIAPYAAAAGSGPVLPAYHAVVLLGYVPNVSLPPGVPPGDGGGYFIAKNSYGTAWGDAGYCYLSDDWVLRYVFSMFAIEAVTG